MAKRAFDLIVGSVLALAALPVIATLAVILAVELRAFPFFLQRRIGTGGVEMGFLKLRTLPVATPKYALKCDVEFELSGLRHFLRRRHLDELPQLFHVVTGQLSLVGPRPRMPDRHEPVDAFYAHRRVEVPQGCTGLWQIGADVDELPSDHPEYDLFYVDHASLRLDVWILWRTVLQVFGLHGGIALADVPTSLLRTPAGQRAPRRPLLAPWVPALAGVTGAVPRPVAAPPVAPATGNVTARDRVIDLTETADAPVSPRVVIAHDYVTQRGGAERVALGLLEAFPGARLVTSIYEPATTFPEFADANIEAFALSRHKAFRHDPRRAFPLLARAWQSHTIDDADIVICSSSGWAHGITTSAPKVVYCHNPARWLYQPDDYLAGAGTAARVARNLLANPLMEWDRRQAETASSYVANSSVVAARILAAYGRECEVIPPPIGLDEGGEMVPVPGVEPGFLLTVSRARGYKNVSLVCDAVEDLPEERLVVLGDLPANARGTAWNARLQGVGRVSDAQLRWLYANCRAVVSASHEDFGLTPLEGNLFGKPAVVLRAGGFLDTVVDQMTGSFIEEESVAAVQEALRRVPTTNPAYLVAYGRSYRQDVFAERMRNHVARTLNGVLTVEASPTAPQTQATVAA